MRRRSNPMPVPSNRLRTPADYARAQALLDEIDGKPTGAPTKPKTKVEALAVTMPSDGPELVDAVNDLQDHLMRACAGKPTAVVYTAIANLLGFMETLAKQPDRKDLFRLIGECMDNYKRIIAN